MTFRDTLPERRFHLSLLAWSVIVVTQCITPSTASAAEEKELDTVIVTGEKIDKNIKDTTAAVTVLTDEDLESGQLKDPLEAATEAPNVVMDSYGNITIRGISGSGPSTGAPAFITGSRPRLVTLIDGTPQAWSGYNFVSGSLWDVQQVEILRGPQSTTQGATSIAGALVVNTNDPTFDQEAAFRVGLENYENGNFKYNQAVMSSGAIVDNELAYRIAIDRTHGNGWLNYNTEGYDVPDLDDTDNYNIRGKLLWQPSNIPELSAKLTVNYHKAKGEYGTFVTNTESDVASKTTDLSSSVAHLQNSNEKSIALDVDYQISSGIKNSFHFNYIDTDLDASGYLATNQYVYDINKKNYMLENRVVFDQEDASLNGVLGLYFARQEAYIYSNQTLDVETKPDTNTSAIYGEGTYAFTPKTKATLGLRIEHEDVDKLGSLQFRTVNVTDTNQDTSDTHYLPKLAIMHEISDSTTLGASVRKGYSPGSSGVNITTGDIYTFDDETVTTYEVSSKSNFGQSSVNASIFYNDYDDFQALNGFDVVNIEQSHTYGLELEATTWATDDLMIRGSAGLLKSEIDQYDLNSAYEGNDLSGAPESNVSLGFTQFIGNHWSVGADVTYVGEYYSDLANDNDNKAGDYTVTNLKAQYLIGDFTIDAYVKNLTDEEVVYYKRSGMASVGQSRTIGLNVTYRM